jgi:NAD(P)-dependent dehydrogenase (short-subunit alcohol dehydrogenase family)
VTGASSGIGECCASFLSERGYKVYGASRRALDMPGVSVLRMDVCEDHSVRAGIAAVLTREGRLDAVVNSAGMGIAGAIEDTSIAEAQDQFDVNFFGVLRVCREVLPVMRQQRAGYIVNIGSIGGLIAIPFQGLYSASKFAVEGLTEAMRVEARPFGIHAVVIEPGDHRTSFTEKRCRTEGSLGRSAYQERCERAVGRMALDEQNGPDPVGVARLVHRVLSTPRPRLRYTVGPASQRSAAWLKRLMPYSVLEKVLSGYYGA